MELPDDATLRRRLLFSVIATLVGFGLAKAIGSTQGLLAALVWFLVAGFAYLPVVERRSRDRKANDDEQWKGRRLLCRSRTVPYSE